MDAEELLQRVRVTAEAVAEAADDCRSVEAVSSEAWLLLDWAAIKMEELHRELLYDVITAKKAPA